MARPLVFYWPRNREAAEARAREVRGLPMSVKGWHGYVEDPADHVIVDNAAPDVARAYRESGARVEWLFPLRREPEPAPEPTPTPADSYRVEQNGPWYSLIDPRGEKVGKSQRTEDDAWALMEDL